MAIEIGTEAPDFTLTNQFGEAVTLSSFRGEKNVVVMFYPFAFTGTCTGELCTIRDQSGDYDNADTVTLSISCDPIHSLKPFAAQESLTHSLLSDFWPHGAVSQAYGVFLEDKGFATRGTFVIDKQGIVRWSVVNGPGDARNSDDVRKALASI
jgi:mycoredoxin-dependent peroxiredoxin